MNLTKKSITILVLKVLQEYSDESHYLTQQDISDKISKLYNLDVERRSIASSINVLIDLNYDINKGQKGGYALLSRCFDKTEASYLLDAIFSSKGITGKEAINMAKEVMSLFSKYDRENYSYIHKSSDLSRTSNEDVFYNISIIHEAMKAKKRVQFNIIDYDNDGNKILRFDGYTYIVSPYYLINNFGRYYLLGNYREKYAPIQLFRIDYMTNVSVKEDWELKPMSALKELPRDFTITKYLNEHLYMLGGNSITATLELFTPKAILAIKDWFGIDVKIKNVDGKLTVRVTCNENALYFWIMQYSDLVRVIEPQAFVDRVKSGLKKALDNYK